MLENEFEQDEIREKEIMEKVYGKDHDRQGGKNRPYTNSELAKMTQDALGSSQNS